MPESQRGVFSYFYLSLFFFNQLSEAGGAVFNLPVKKLSDGEIK